VLRLDNVTMAIVNERRDNIDYTITPAIHNNGELYSMATIHITITVCNYHSDHLNNIIFDLSCLHDYQLLNNLEDYHRGVPNCSGLMDVFN